MPSKRRAMTDGTHLFHSFDFFLKTERNEERDTLHIDHGDDNRQQRYDDDNLLLGKGQ